MKEHYMNIAILETLTNPALRTEKALKQHLVNKTSSGTPWLVAEIPSN